MILSHIIGLPLGGQVIAMIAIEMHTNTRSITATMRTLHFLFDSLIFFQIEKLDTGSEEEGWPGSKRTCESLKSSSSSSDYSVGVCHPSSSSS